MVKRYSLDGSNCDSYYGCSAKMTECDKGGAYVLATDYAALEAARDALERRINPDGAPVDVAALCMEIDAVTDERDELKRRCEKLVARCQELAELACYCEYNSCEDRISTCEYCDDASSLIAIAEGRDND